MQWLRNRVDESHGAQRDLWLKALEQARNFERLVQLERWWKKSHP
jgi:hypothetical protein